MFREIALCALLAFVVGCSREAESPVGPPVTKSGAMSASSPPGSRAQPAMGRATFASLPDTGSLVAYPSRLIRRDGAYTWHRAALSEQHALRAVVDGHLSVTTPSGETLDFAYERHVEHPSGDWTWIGKLGGAAEGEEAILTFGEKAAFGTIAQPGKEPLRLTVRDGASWLVETDRAALASINNAATRPRKPDYFVPPKLAIGPSTGASIASQEAAVQTTAGATATAANTVDLVLGYTSGFAASLGGQSQAVTRLNFLVAVTNQAYVSSQVEAQVRLVHALQVDYPDATSNDTVLEELTGFRAPSTKTTPAAAFSALRAAREQYGGDVVSLVRKFNTPENDGCGIAWLIGGGQSGIAPSDEYFGYSVVSDGTDVGADGKTYYCRDETLAHELGHNMGSQHDRAAATYTDTTTNGQCRSTTVACPHYGFTSYSFGHKTGTGAGNFYTVMAYGDTGQTRYRVFSNPRTTYCGGFPCGVTNEADNARSLALVIPTIATFRATVVTAPVAITVVPDDLDGDGKSDMFWRHAASGSFATWLMDGVGVRQVINIDAKAPANYSVVGTGDFDGDGRADILWTSAALDLWLWTSTGASYVTVHVGNYPSSWTPAGVGDVSGDGKADILWRHESTGSFAYWVMSGPTPTQVVNVEAKAPASYWIVAIRDFNGDGRQDVLWTSAARDLWLWSASGASFATVLVGNYPAGWMPLGGGDINADGKADVLWRHEPSGSFAYWLMNGAVATQAINVEAKAPSNYRLVSSGDFNGDGKADLMWTSPSLDLWLWTGTGTTFSTVLVSQYPGSWAPLE